MTLEKATRADVSHREPCIDRGSGRTLASRRSGGGDPAVGRPPIFSFNLPRAL